MARASLIGRAGLTAALLMGSSGAWAYAWPAGATIKAATNGVPVIAGAVSRTASVATSGGAAALRASQLLGVGSASAALTLSRGVGLSNLALVARIAAGALGPVVLIGLAYEGIVWATDHWEVPAEDGPTPGRLWGATLVDGSSNPGAWGQLSSCRIASPCVYSEFESKMVAECNARAVASGSGRYCDAPSVTVVGSSFRWTQVMRLANGSYLANFVVEGDDPAVNPSPVAGVPATDGQLENAITTALQAQPTLSGSVLDAALAYKPAELALVSAPQVVTGPATVNGGTKTSTKVETAGTTTTTINTTYNLSYAGDVVTITQTDVQTVTHPDSSTSTTTSSTAAPAGDPPPPEEKPDVCKDHPDASGCAEFGEHDPEPEFPEEQRALSWVPSLSAVGACPAPETATVHGQSISISWQPVCDLASGLRPVVLAVAWLSAGAFVFGVGRKVAA